MEKEIIGKIYDGRWKVIEKVPAKRNIHTCRYVLENIFNHKKIKIDSRTMVKVANGETTISKVMYWNIKFDNFCK